MAIPLNLSEVPNIAPYIQYVAGSGQTVYPYPFPITQDSDLVVVINGVTQATDSTYTLSGQGNDTGGNVTLNSGSTAGDIVTLYRDVPIERITQIGQNSGFSSAAFNAEFNNLYLIMQQLEASIALCLQVPNTNNPAPSTVLTPAAYANKYLTFDQHGNPQPGLLTSVGTITPALVGNLINPQTQAEDNAGVTPVNETFQPANVLRYGADPTGVSDSTAAFLNAQLAYPHPFVPEGTYNVTGLQQFGRGFWGDGLVYINGTFFSIPIRPTQSAQVLSTRSNLSRNIAGFAPLVLIGDSIAAHYYASSIDKSYFNILQKELNLGYQGNSEPVLTDFNDNGSGGATFYGLTYSGGITFGTTGPVGTSIILAAGASISFSGNYGFVDVFYNQAAGAGSLKFAFNGTTYATKSCAGTTALDMTTYDTPTGQAGTTGTYSITASGGPVEITALIRWSAPVSVPVLCWRVAKGAQPTSTFSAQAVLSSINAQINNAAISSGAVPICIVDLGTNDMINPATYATPAAMTANLITIFTYLKQQAHCAVMCMGLMRPNASLWTINPGYTFEDYQRGIQEACETCGVPMLRLDQVDFQSEGLQQDGLHPNDAGQLRISGMLIDFLSTVYIPAGWTQRVHFKIPNQTSDGWLQLTTTGVEWSLNQDVAGNVSDGTLGASAIVQTVSTVGSTLDFFTANAAGQGNVNRALRIDGNGALLARGSLGLYGNNAVTQVTGWGTPTGASVEANFAAGSGQTMAVISAAVAKIITDLKALGLYAA